MSTDGTGSYYNYETFKVGETAYIANLQTQTTIKCVITEINENYITYLRENETQKRCDLSYFIFKTRLKALKFIHFSLVHRIQTCKSEIKDLSEINQRIIEEIENYEEQKRG